MGEWEDYDSGPFCHHWYHPADCEETCERCGHSCAAHADLGYDECECDEWKEPK